MVYTQVLFALFVYSTYSQELNALPNVTKGMPMWGFKCVPDMGCQRSRHPSSTHLGEGSEIFSSLAVCRTVCGQYGGIWPKPQLAALGTHTVPFHPKYIRYDMEAVPFQVQPLLQEMTEVTTEQLQAECNHNVTKRTKTPLLVFLHVKSSSIEMSWGVNESYKLDLRSKKGEIVIHIVAETVYGARHGLETLSNLVAGDLDSSTYKCSLRIVSNAMITDRPAYKHRGLLLDTSRNFYPVEDIKRTIHAMGANKMNVFHWHVTDSQSFPLQSARVPQFTRYGAYSEMEMYTTDEVLDIIDFARVRGVRLVVEIDSPGHVGSGWQWGKEYGLGDLIVCHDTKKITGFCYEPPCGQLNVANHNIYDVLRKLYQDIVSITPKPRLFHMGGDEVFIKCWNSSQEILDYMSANNYANTKGGFLELWSDFHKKALEIWHEEVARTGEQPQPVIVWSSELTNPPHIHKYFNTENFVIEVWEPKDSDMPLNLLDLGYSIISVPNDIWYLDHGFWGSHEYYNWRRMYGHLLPVHENALGGEVAMWSEYIGGMGIDARVWPRTAAVAERLWSNPSTNAGEAEPRLQRQRERLVNRGIQADVLSPGWCAQNDMLCL